MMKLNYQIVFFVTISFFPLVGFSQMDYQFANNKTITAGSYGRIGVDWNYENNGSIGRRLNLNNMGSMGGRLEEQDYLELATALHFMPFSESDSTEIYAQFRLAAFSRNLNMLAYENTAENSGLALALPEMFVEARNINNTGLNVWIGARLYRGPDIHIADYRYFNDHSGQGVGFEYKGFRVMGLYISSNDTSSTLPPFFYLNIATGTPSIALRQRMLYAVEKDINLDAHNMVTLLAEYHKMGEADPETDTLGGMYNYPSDYGAVFGARWEYKFNKMPESYLRLAARYGTRIANGGDGGVSQTWKTFGAQDSVSENFDGAYSFSVVADAMFNVNAKHALNPYFIYTLSKGGAESNGKAITYYNKEVYNRKKELAVGMRNTWFITEKFHLLTELHYAQRQDGEEKWAAMTKFSLAPTFVPTGLKSAWARPQFRFITSVAHYNQQAKETLYSPYLQFVGQKSWGYFIGIRAEWWIF